MNEQRELERHNRVIENIKNAKNRDELPKISFSNISSFLATNVYFNNEKISQKLFQPLVDAIIDYGMLAHPNVKEAFIKVITENYKNVSDKEIENKYNEILKTNRINYILSEITQRNLKLDEFIKKENLEIHKQVVKDIKNTFEIKDLPKVGIGKLNEKLLRAVNDNDFINNIKTGEIKKLTEAYLNNNTYLEKESIIKEICSKYDLNEKDKSLMKEQILGSLMLDETIEYTLEELALKEKRKLEIYKINHEEVMEAIKQANRISQLPPNLTISSLSNYLNGNTTLYTNDDRITIEDLKTLTDLLMDGYKWEDEVIINEVKKISNLRYPEKKDAFDILYNKFKNLPRTYYLVEEIKYSSQRQVEFIGRGSSNVNIYFIPNNKSPLDGGRFYNCYINRVNNLDLSQILPLDLDSIVPPEMDIDSVEWYVRQYDETFKTAGGIILNKDETIGNVNVFRPNDGKVGVSIEEKQKIDEISNLDSQIEEKNKKLKELDNEIEAKENKSNEVENKMKEMLLDYEKKALRLHMELLNNISELKSSMEEQNEESKKRSKI